MAHKARNLADLVHHRLKQLRESERHAGKLLGRMAKAVEAPELSAALQAREAALRARDAATDHLFALIDRKPHDATCPLTDALVAETRTFIDDEPAGPVRDAALLAAAETLEHLLLARYGALRRETAAMELKEAAAPLEAARAEARRALDALPKLAGEVGQAPGAATPFTLKQAALAGLR